MAGSDDPAAQDSAPFGEFSLPAEVFERELEEIRARREVRGIDASELEPAPLHPDPDLGLIGMCLSGGGIRSATFGLGVVQALARAKVFDRIDYLSTVSGGGFTGSMLSSVLNDPKLAEGPFPVRKDTGEDEPPALHHLRDGSRYLSSGGLAQSLRLPMVVIRGMILSLLIILPMLMLAVFLTELAYEGGLWPDYEVLTGQSHFSVLPIITVLFLGCLCLLPLVRSTWGTGMRWSARNRLELALSLGLGVVLLAALMEPLIDLVSAAIETTATDWSPADALLARFDPGQTPVLSSIGLTAGLIVSVVIGVVLVRKLPTSALLGLLGLLGPAVLFALYLGLCLVQIDSPFLPSALQTDLQTVAAASQSRTLRDAVYGAQDCTETSETSETIEHPDCQVRAAHARVRAAVENKNPELEIGPLGLIYVLRTAPVASAVTPDTAPDAAPRCDPDATPEWLVVSPSLATIWPTHQVGPETGTGRPTALLPSCTPIVDAADGHMPEDDLNRFLETKEVESARCAWPKGDDDGVLPLSSDVLDPCLGSFRVRQRPVLTGKEQLLEMDGARLGLWGEPSSQTMIGDLAFVAIALSAFLYVLLFYNVNVASLHGFYRDRLSKTYLFREHPTGDGVESMDTLKLSQLNVEGSPAPYHLINVVLNITSGDEGSLRGRNSAFFILSKHYCGGPRTDYQPTVELEKVDPHFNLGTAMAISGAAAAPNMGALTPGSLTFIMTLLNLRMGYWLPNPKSIAKDKRKPRHFRAGPSYILDEALGRLTTSRPLINVSDGGHLENLGCYELLRRRCSLIIAVDGEHDPDMTFVGLVSLMRYAEIDLGIRIEIDLDPMELGEDGYSSAHWAIGTILYGKDEQGVEQVGHLVYIKSSLTRDVSPVLARYHRYNPDFPHETTADQFFSEEQFEAYRSLGDTIGRALLTSEDAGALLPPTPSSASSVEGPSS